MKTPNAPLRVGIIGARFAAEFHYDSIQTVRGVPVQVVGVTSSNPASREKFAAARGIRAFDSVDELIEACDVVDVCTPPYAHEEIAVRAVQAGRHVIVEKPFTGSFLNREAYDAQTEKPLSFNEQRYREAVSSACRIAEAVRAARTVLCFAENWHFLPSGLKACRLMMRSMFKKGRDKTGQAVIGEPDPGARVLLYRGTEAHSGSTSPVYGDLQFAGGGAIMGKCCHPLGLGLYIKRLEGMVREGTPVRPVAVSGHCGYLTSSTAYRDPEYDNPRKVRRGYVDGEDWGLMVVRFEDGSLAQVESNEFTLGGVSNTFEILSNKFRVQGNLSPNDSMRAYSPSPEVFEPEYIVEKLETSGGWNFPATEENLTMGYIEEMQVFFNRIAAHREGRSLDAEPPYLPASDDIELAVDSVKLMYGAYVSDERGGKEVSLAELDALLGA